VSNLLTVRPQPAPNAELSAQTPKKSPATQSALAGQGPAFDEALLLAEKSGPKTGKDASEAVSAEAMALGVTAPGIVIQNGSADSTSMSQPAQKLNSQVASGHAMHSQKVSLLGAGDPLANPLTGAPTDPLAKKSQQSLVAASGPNAQSAEMMQAQGAGKNLAAQLGENALSAAGAEGTGSGVIRDQGFEMGSDLASELNITDFQVSSPNAGQNANSSFQGGGNSQLSQRSHTPSSTLSTDDFLNLRGKSAFKKLTPSAPISGNDTAAMGLQMGLQVKDGQGAPFAVVDAPVTSGHLMKPILSHDAIHQMTQQVSHMNQMKQDGEIKIRLRPDHLGELSMSIKNQGSQISVRIHAQDSEAKQILESSLGTLRDSLSQQNLTVARMEVAQMAPSSNFSGAENNSMQMDSGAFQRQQNDTAQDQRQSGWESGDFENRKSNLPGVGMNGASSRSANRSSSAGSTGLDLIA
jgi:flagellar hook-length control protein FliK